MCGIAGICNLSSDTEPDETLLRRMVGSLRHRGPDQFGIYVDEQAGLCSARLSIIDIASGQQPLPNEDESLWIVFNGEVFNYLELRTDLLKKGHLFRTQSDTEVVLHAFEEYGKDCLALFNGDFAFAIWNRLDESLFLARDRAGVRPLFYTMAGGRLLFGSEIKALLADTTVPAQLDAAALCAVFTFWSTVAPQTAFSNIFELPPGCYAEVKQGQLATARYWEMNFAESSSERRREDDLADELASLLVDATRIRLRADVPVGTYLSGGLDSSLLTAIVRAESSQDLETFSIQFRNQHFDESEHQQAIVRELGGEHHAIQISEDDVGRNFPGFMRHVETPVLRTAGVPMFLLSRLVHDRGFKVVLTGEGADEFFGGYDLYKEAKIRQYAACRSGTRGQQLFRRLYGHIPEFQAASGQWLSAFFTHDGADLASPYYGHLIRWRTTSRTRRFLARDIAPASLPTVPAAASSWSVLGRAQHLESTVFLPHYLLSSQGDRPSMAHSVEGRYPYLDHRVITFAAALPERLKIRALLEKYLLRKVAQRWLPSSVAMRRKQPYRAPIHRSFFPMGGEPDPYVTELLSTEAIRRSGYFKPAAVNALLGKLRSGRPLGETDDMALAGILSTQLLDQLFISSRPEPAPITSHDDLVVHRRHISAAPTRRTWTDRFACPPAA